MSYKCQMLQTRLTFNNNVFVKNCDVRLIIILCVISTILPIIKCAKLENPQIRLLINDDELLQEKTNLYEQGAATASEPPHDNSGEHFNLYRSELKRLSYETIHRILRDENEPSYRREDTELRYYQKRSPSFEQNHQLIKRSVKEKQFEFSLSHQNLTEFVTTPQILKDFNLVSLLDLSYNYLPEFNSSLLKNIPKLKILNLQNNALTNIPLQGNSTLRTLNLNNNLIKTASLSSNIYLRNLYLSGNLIDNLSSLQLFLLKNLETLDISHNLLKNSETSFFAERMHNLKHLNLAFNQLGSIYRETFYNLLSLNTLLLSHNNISDIDYETFLALPNLQYLDLSFNNLQGKSIRALQGITGLVALNIGFNPQIGPYMQEFVASWSLKELDASGTGLCQIPAALAQSVRTLKLTHNWLKLISCGDLDSYPLLQYLDLSFSHIEQIEDDALGRLEILEILMLDHNKLLKIPFSLPVSLEHLFLQNNNILEVQQQTFQGLDNLKTLDLSHNKLLYLPDIQLPKLQTLNLQSSEIRGISQGIIHSLPKLNELMLEDNPIKCTDLLGIAEWASTCRLRVEKEGEVDGQVTVEEEADSFVQKVQNFKNKFEKMHNFYEQFGLNSTTLAFVNDTQLSYLKTPACVKENQNTFQQQIKTLENYENDQEKKLKINFALSKTFKEINFNQNSMTFRPLLSTEKSFLQHNKIPTNTNKTNAVEKQQPQELEHKQVKYEPAVKKITMKNPTQTVTAMQSSILNEKQQEAGYTTIKSLYNSFSTPTISEAVAATTTATSTNVLGNEIQTGTKIIVKPRFTSETKTFEHLTANVIANANAKADTDANADAIVLATATTNQQHEITLIGNTPTKTSSNLTKIFDAVSKQTKELQEVQQQHKLQNMLHKTIFTKTFQTTKSKKWLKQDTVANKGEVKDVTEIMLKQHTSSSSADMNGPQQFIKSTTFATPINSEIQATAKALSSPPPTLNTFKSVAATTTIAEAFTVKLSKHDNVKGAGDEMKLIARKDLDVGDSKIPTTTRKLEINLENENQLHEIQTKIATTKEIKFLEAENPQSIQTKQTEKAKATSNKRMAEITLRIPPEPAANKELKSFTHTTQINTHIQTNTGNKKLRTTTTTLPNNKITATAIEKPAIKANHELETTTTKATTIWKAFKTIDAKTVAAKTTTTKAAAAVAVAETATNFALMRDKDLALNYNDNDNIEHISKTENKTKKNSMLATTYVSANNSNNSSSSISKSDMKNNRILKTFNMATTTTINNIVNQQQQHPAFHVLQNMMSHYRQSLHKKNVNVESKQSNSNECNSTVTTKATQLPEEFGKKPTIETTLELGIPSKTSIEIPTASASVAESSPTPRTTITTIVLHKHEPLQLLVKDRHLIGTPLLMHKGENLMVTADELILPTNNHNAEQEGNNGSNNNKKEHYDLETKTMANDNKNKQHLETSQHTTTTQLAALTKVTANNQTKTQNERNVTAYKKHQENTKLQNSIIPDDTEKIRKANDETRTKKPSLIMKKMTIITKQHDEAQHVSSASVEALENEAHVKQFDSSHSHSSYQELKPLSVQAHMLKHSTVNTPINGNNNQFDQIGAKSANLLKQPHTFQHEHELLIQQILQDQPAETHAKLTKSEQWSDLRKAESKENHPGLILLVSSGLFLILLLGLMHVYRCDMPWRRHSPNHHLRPHQRHNHSLEDDSHSFLSYSEGTHKWHHSTRLEGPYNSPLHNLHIRELQKISATEKPTAFKSSASNFKSPPLSHSLPLNNSRSLSQSSTTTTSTASASSSVILDDETFYIEMTPDSGQISRALQSELLPMELLKMNSAQTLDYQDNAGDSQTSMEDECIVHFQQQHKLYLPSNSTSSGSIALPCSTSSAISTTSQKVKPSAQSRKFGMW